MVVKTVKKSFALINSLVKKRYSTSKMLEMSRSKKSSFWKKENQKRILVLFNLALTYVPAYKDFLKRKKISRAVAQKISDPGDIPIMNKKNYLRKYPLKKLCWDGTINKPLVFTSTSGSTGKPFYFPRGQQLDTQAAVLHELFYKHASKANTKDPTLVLVCFGMGVWIGGLITYQSFKILAEKGEPISILTPGINKEEIFKALKDIAPNYKNLIMVGYAPFMKDLVDEAPSRGINLKKYKPRFIFAAEAFTENFRDYIAEKAGVSDVLLDTMNIYGSADIGAMAFETPLAIFIRRLGLKNKKLFNDLFGGTDKTPTLAQYYPQFIQFEEEKGEVFLTGNNSLPLVRYAIGDNGGVHSFDEIVKIFNTHGVDLEKEAQKAGLKKFIWKMPFVYVYERSDLSTKLYGAIIYPEYVKAGLHNKQLEKYLTGKFTMITKFDKKHSQFLEINIELKPGMTESEWLAQEALRSIEASLIERSAEYENNANKVHDKVKPRIVFWPYGDALHFKSGIKQSWVKPSN